MNLWMVKTMTEEEKAIHEERKTFIKTELNRFYKRKISHEKAKPLNEQYDEMMNFIKWDLDSYNYYAHWKVLEKNVCRFADITRNGKRSIFIFMSY